MASPSSSRNPDATKIALPKAKRATVACTACRKRQVRCQKAPTGSDCLRCQRMNIPCAYIPLNVQRQAWEEQQRDALLRDLVTSPSREGTNMDPPAAELSRTSRTASSYPAAGIAPASGTSPTDRADFSGMDQRSHMPANYSDRWIASSSVRPDVRYPDQVQPGRSPYATEPNTQQWSSHVHAQAEPLRRHATPVLSGAGTLPSHPDAQSAYARSYDPNTIPTAPTSLPRLQTIMPPAAEYGRGYSTSPVTSVASSAGGWSERSATPNMMSADRFARAPSPWTSSSDPRTAPPWPVNAQTRWQQMPSSTTSASAGAIPSNPSDAQYYSQVPIWQYSSRNANAAQASPTINPNAPTAPYDMASRPPVPNDWTDHAQYRQ